MFSKMELSFDGNDRSLKENLNINILVIQTINLNYFLDTVENME